MKNEQMHGAARTHLVHTDDPKRTFCDVDLPIEIGVAHPHKSIHEHMPFKFPICNSCLLAQQVHGKAIVDAAAARQAELDANRHPKAERVEKLKKGKRDEA